jgi:hypothetical protein
MKVVIFQYCCAMMYLGSEVVKYVVMLWLEAWSEKMICIGILEAENVVLLK